MAPHLSITMQDYYPFYFTTALRNNFLSFKTKKKLKPLLRIFHNQY